MRTPKVNVDKIKRALKHIKKDFRRFEMGTWGRRHSTDGLTEAEIKKYVPPCGTQACFGGWLYVLDAKSKKEMDERMVSLISRDIDIEYAARKIAGFTEDEASKIFVGAACDFGTPKKQYKVLVAELNDLFESRKMRTRLRA